MKIALLILHADPARGGAERYTVDLAHALAKRGHTVKLLATSFATDIPDDMRVPLRAQGLTRTARYKDFLDSIDAHLAKENYDIRHAMLPVRHADIYHPHAGMAVAQLGRANILFNPRRRKMAQVERALIESDENPIVLALSDYVKQSIRQHYDLPDARLVKLFNAVDLDRYTPVRAPINDGKIHALMIAQDFARKGLKEAIEALAALSDPRVELTVVGKDNPAPYQSLSQRLKVTVTFSGPTRDTRPFYNSHDFFLLPTHHDPCSLVVLESLAMGLPVISTKFNGACEIMQEGIHGHVIDSPTNQPALVEAMRHLLDPQKREEMAHACLALRPKLSYDHHLDQLIRIYTARVSN